MLSNVCSTCDPEKGQGHSRLAADCDGCIIEIAEAFLLPSTVSSRALARLICHFGPCPFVVLTTAHSPRKRTLPDARTTRPLVLQPPPSGPRPLDRRLPRLRLPRQGPRRWLRQQHQAPGL